MVLDGILYAAGLTVLGAFAAVARVAPPVTIQSTGRRGAMPALGWVMLGIVVLALGFGLAHYMVFKFAPGVAKTWP